MAMRGAINKIAIVESTLLSVSCLGLFLDGVLGDEARPGAPAPNVESNELIISFNYTGLRANMHGHSQPEVRVLTVPELGYNRKQ